MLDVLPLEAELQDVWVGGLAGPSAHGKAGLESDSAGGTRPGAGGGLVGFRNGLRGKSVAT